MLLAQNSELNFDQIFHIVEQSTAEHRFVDTIVFLYYILELTLETARSTFEKLLPQATRMDNLNRGCMISAKDMLGLPRGTLWDVV